MNPRILHTYLNRYYTEQELLAEVRKNKKLIEIFNLKCVGINTNYVNTREKMNRKMISIQYECLDLYLKKLIKKMSIIKSIINGLVIKTIPLYIPKPLTLPYILQLIKYFEIRQKFMINGKFICHKEKIKFHYSFYENAYRFNTEKARSYYRREGKVPYVIIKI